MVAWTLRPAWELRREGGQGTGGARSEIRVPFCFSSCPPFLDLSSASFVSPFPFQLLSFFSSPLTFGRSGLSVPPSHSALFRHIVQRHCPTWFWPHPCAAGSCLLQGAPTLPGLKLSWVCPSSGLTLLPGEALPAVFPASFHLYFSPAVGLRGLGLDTEKPCVEPGPMTVFTQQLLSPREPGSGNIKENWTHSCRP